MPRSAGERAGDIRIVSRSDISWIWLIPLDGERTSVGAVISKKVQAGRQGRSAEETLEAMLTTTPAVVEQMRNAKRISKARFAADFCYSSLAYAGDRWLLAGDAGSFLDPIFSTGVQLALDSGLEAAQAIDRALRSRKFSTATFAAYEQIQRRRYRACCRFVRGFYDPSFRDLFFHPTHRFGLLDAMVEVLAGNWQPCLADRLKGSLFFALVRVQRIFLWFRGSTSRIQAWVRPMDSRFSKP